MNYNEIIIYNLLGSDGYRQYQQNVETIRAIQTAQKERERKERRAKWNSIGSVLVQSIEPTAEFAHKWHGVDSKHPNIERCFITGKYIINMGKIVYDERIKLDDQLQRINSMYLNFAV